MLLLCLLSLLRFRGGGCFGLLLLLLLIFRVLRSHRRLFGKRLGTDGAGAEVGLGDCRGFCHVLVVGLA